MRSSCRNKKKTGKAEGLLPSKSLLKLDLFYRLYNPAHTNYALLLLGLTKYSPNNSLSRSSRGWSYGGGVTDPRTGEIIKGKVTLGSLRVRQDYLLAQGLIGDFDHNTDNTKIMDMSLARMRQLAAHEVGHTLGLPHNYIASSFGRASVMDYPHLTVKAYR